MAFVRSPHAHARVRSVRGARFSAADLAGRVWPQQIVPPPGLDVSPVPHPLLADGEVRYVGQPVAAVVAASRAPRPRTSPSRWRSSTSRCRRSSIRGRARRWCAGRSTRGTSPGAFARAAHVVRTETVIPRLAAMPMEPRGALAAAGRRPADVLDVVAERAPAARAARADASGARRRHPGGRAGRRRRVRLEGHAAGRGAARRARGARAAAAGASGPRTGSENLAGRAAGPRAARRGRARLRRRRPHPRAARPRARRPRRLPAAEHRRSRRTRPRCCSPGATTSRTSR